MEKKEAKTTLRYPQKVKEEFKRIADEEGLSENAALVQALVWALKFREQMHGGAPCLKRYQLSMRAKLSC
ncbi:hypothetical protein FHK17_22105 [Salmonella enterica]|nr:hypothetical protein [Salmonella enterica]